MLARYTFILLILCPLVGYSQFGVNLKYITGQSDLLDEYQISQNGVHLAVEYGFRLKEKRLEFHPAIGYRRTFSADEENPGAPDAKHGFIDALDVDFHTSIYPFDFGGDCDCPTWSKEGNLMKKGFFLEASPGLSYQNITRTYYESGFDPPQVPFSTSNVLWKFSLGAGLDIGLSETMTLTPIFSWTMFSDAEWEGLSNEGLAATLDDQAHLGYGLRMSYKPDPKRRR